MAYDRQLADRIRGLLMFEPDVSERTMFGGLSFLVGGHMAVAVSARGGLLLRVDPEEGEALLAREHVEPFVMRGRPMTGWARITEDGVAGDESLAEWVRIGLDVARSQPPKS